MEATKPIASASQPFGVITRTHLTWAHVPWERLGAWWLGVAATDVVTRLRRLLERPGERQPMRRIALGEVATHALDLLGPSLQRLQVSAQVNAPAPVHVLADPVALEQIVHNLVQNALQALEQAGTR